MPSVVGCEEGCFFNALGGAWLWMNPPFDVFGRIVEKAKREGARIWLLIPLWESGWWRLAGKWCKDGVWLPKGPLFQRRGELLPAPRWRCLVGGFDFSMAFPSASIWCKLLTGDGDVEANPGPSQEEIATFTLFVDKFSESFLSLMDKLQVARRLISLRMEVTQKAVPVEELGRSLGVVGLEEDTLLTHVVAFESYAEVRLLFEGTGVCWGQVKAKSEESMEVRALREELERLKLKLEEKEKSPFLPLSAENALLFAKESGRAKWMVKGTEIFLSTHRISEKVLLRNMQRGSGKSWWWHSLKTPRGDMVGRPSLHPTPPRLSPPPLPPSPLG